MLLGGEVRRHLARRNRSLHDNRRQWIAIVFRHWRGRALPDGCGLEGVGLSLRDLVSGGGGGDWC